MGRIDKEIAQLMQGVDDSSASEDENEFHNESRENMSSEDEEDYQNTNDNSDDSDNDSEEYSDQNNEDESMRLGQLLSATMDRSGRMLHAEGPTSKRREDIITKNDNKIELSDLIQTLDAADDSEDEGVENSPFEEVVLREDAKKQLKILADKNTMFQALNEYQMRRLEKEETEKLVDNELKDWEGLVDRVHTSRVKPLIYADAESKKKTPTISGLKIQGEFEKTLNQKRNMITREKVPVPDKLQMDELNSKEAIVEQARKIAKKKRLLAIENAKLARLKKIKSKEYRRRLRRRKAKEEEKLQEFEEMDEDAIKERLEEEHRNLVTERITLRHKAQTAWSKRAQRYTHANKNTLSALSQKFQLANELRSKQSSITENEEEMMDNLIDKEKREEVVENLLSLEDDPKKGIYNMKFMKEARLKQKEDTLRLLEEVDESDHSSNEDDDEEEEQTSHKRDSQYGKLSFTASQKNNSPTDDDEMEDVALQSNSFVLQKAKSTSLKEEVMQDSDSDESEDEADKKGQARESSSESEDSETDSASDESSEASFEQNTDIPAFLLQRVGTTKKVPNKKIMTTLESDSSDSDDDEANPWLYKNNVGVKDKPKKRPRKSEVTLSDSDESESENDDITFQQDVKRAAFAADNVKLEFEKEKKRTIDESILLPNLESENMPGWGSDFIGEGISWEEEFIQKKKQIQDFEAKIKTEKAKERADYELDHVVIRDTASVPDSYLLETHRHSRVEDHQLIFSQLHDRAHSLPLGPEWNSVRGFNSGVAPRINIVPGRKIEPISKKKGELFAKASIRSHSIEVKKRKRS